MDGYRDFTLDSQKFTSLPSLVEDLHKHGQHYVMILVFPLLSHCAVFAAGMSDKGIMDALGPSWSFLALGIFVEGQAAVNCDWKSP